MSRREPIDWNDYRGAAIVVVIMLVGILTMSSAVVDARGTFYRQLVWYVIGLVAMFAVSRMDYRTIARMATSLLVLTALSLVAVLLVGRSGGGSQRWLGVGPLRLQPSEFAKLAVIIWTAMWAATHPRVGGARLIELVVPLLVVAGITGLIVVQPDLGTGVAVLSAGCAVLLVAGIQRRLLVWLGAGGVGSVIMAWFFLLRPYQKKRVIGFLNPESDPYGVGYHTIQSKIAIGAGGVRGSGFGQGQQTKLQFLPEQHTDFIFSVWSEEWGYFGVLAVLLIYTGLVLWIARVAIEAKDALGRLLASGVMAHLVLHIVVNLCMVVGWAPVVGLPLPWMTYGGSAILVNSLAMGVVLSVQQRRHMF